MNISFFSAIYTAFDWSIGIPFFISIVLYLLLGGYKRIIIPSLLFLFTLLNYTYTIFCLWFYPDFQKPLLSLFSLFVHHKLIIGSLSYITGGVLFGVTLGLSISCIVWMIQSTAMIKESSEELAEEKTKTITKECEKKIKLAYQERDAAIKESLAKDTFVKNVTESEKKATQARNKSLNHQDDLYQQNTQLLNRNFQLANEKDGLKAQLLRTKIEREVFKNIVNACINNNFLSKEQVDDYAKKNKKELKAYYLNEMSNHSKRIIKDINLFKPELK